MAGAKELPDQSARIAALTELERSLLVEAGAGSGKTSIMAGRVAMLFARGVEPKRVAAITFTEFAASELMIRITRFVAELAKGEIPRDLEIAFPEGVSAEQRANLERAKKSLDQLVCSTIERPAACAGPTNRPKALPSRTNQSLDSTSTSASPSELRPHNAIEIVHFEPIRSSTHAKAAAPRPAVTFKMIPKWRTSSRLISKTPAA